MAENWKYVKIKLFSNATPIPQNIENTYGDTFPGKDRVGTENLI